MQLHKGEFGLERMAKVLSVSMSGYYRYCKVGKSQHTLRDEVLSTKLIALFHQFCGVYGSERLMKALHKIGEPVGIHRVRRLMAENELIPKRHKRFKVTTKSNAKATTSPNRLKQDFTASRPNEKWVGDITYIWTQEGWLYLATVMDLFSRKIIGFSLSARINKELVIHALHNAVLRNGKPDDGLFHSDRGSQYTSQDFKQALARLGLAISNSGTGNCYDNAAMESFYASLKTEYVDHENFGTREEAKNGIFDYIEIFYNKQRSHSYLGFISPEQFENNYRYSYDCLH